MIQIGRVYDQAEDKEHYRILVDRLWPRGISKESKAWDEWFGKIAPSPQLRKWFGHDPDKWDDFRIRYMAELSQKHQETKHLRDLEKTHGTIVLLYAAKEKQYNHAKVLQEFLEQSGKDSDQRI